MNFDASRVITPRLLFVTGAFALATLLSLGGRWSWACELLVTFRTHFALVLCVALIAAVVMRLWLIAGVAALALAINLWPMSAALFGSTVAAEQGARPVRVVAFNVNVNNGSASQIAAYLATLSPDVVVLEEFAASNPERLASLLPGLPHWHAGMRDVVVLSRWPLSTPPEIGHDALLPGVPVDIDIGDRRLRLYALHLQWPLVPEAAEVRNAQLLALGREFAACVGACLAVGDFNTSPWSSHFRRLIETSGFHDCAAGRGFLPTWPAGLPAFLRIRIDHCLASPAVAVAEVRVGESVGSDHLATVNDLLIGTIRK